VSLESELGLISEGIREAAVAEARADRVEGVNPKQAQGRKKIRPHVLPIGGLIPTTVVMQLGADKYDPMNWRDNPIALTDYLDAIMRHWLAIADGEDIDPESGQSHMAHIAATSLIVLDAAAVGTLEDDRPTRGTAAETIRRLKAE